MSITKKTILLTGGTGYLGSKLANKLCSKYKVVILKRSFSSLNRLNGIKGDIKFYNIDQINLREIFLNNHIDIVFHCATNYGRGVNNSLDIVESNLILPITLLQLSKQFNVTAFINTDTILDKGVNSYALSKSQFNDWLQILSSDLKCINVKIEHFYGPDDDKTKFVSHLVSLILKDVEAIDLTKGEQVRYFLHVDDVINAFELLIEKIDQIDNGFLPLELGSIEGTSIRSVAELIKELSLNDKTKLNFGTLPYRTNEVMNPKIDLKKINEFGWKQGITLREGLLATINYEKKML